MDILVLILFLGLFSKGSCVMCSQCDSDIDPDCAHRPPPPNNCTLCTELDHITGSCVGYEEVDFCIIERRYINDTLIRITRDCSPYAMRNSCDSSHLTHYDTPIKICFYTCKTTGCNHGNGAHAAFHVVAMLWMVVVIMC